MIFETFQVGKFEFWDFPNVIFWIFEIFKVCWTWATCQLKDVIFLLNMKQANALLLLESLSDPKQTNNYQDMLNEVGVSNMDGDKAVKILVRRVDLK